MLKVSDNVNGKFDIVLSDGYRSQLHSKEKTSTKVDQRLGGKSKPVNKAARTRTKHEQIIPKRQKNTKHDVQPPDTVGKTKKSSRMAAQFDKTPGKIAEATGKHKLGKSSSSAMDNSTILTSGNAAFVTKGDLASLLNALTNNEDASVLQNRNTYPDHDVNVTSVPDSEISGDKPEAKSKQKTDQQQVKLKSVVEPVINDAPKSTDNVMLSTVAMEITKPTAMRSSFAVGAPGLVISDPHDDKTARHRQWMKELDQQIQAKKEKEQEIKKNESSYFSSQTGTDQATGYFDDTTNKKDYSVKTIGESSQQQQQIENSPGRYGRGRALMSMISSDREDQQRQKIFEHQKAVEQQVEDRRRRKEEERQRRLREDALEEARLAKETAELQEQFEEELRRNKEKEEQAKNRVRLLQEGISKAYESAQQVKREKRRNHLQASITEGNTSRGQDNQIQQAALQNRSSSVRSVNHSTTSQKQEVVPPLHLNSSYSPSDTKFIQKLNNVTSPSSTTKLNQSSSPEREIKTSYSEPQSHDLLHHWAEEDVGRSSCFIDEHHVYDETRSLQSSRTNDHFIPFLRTTSATLLSESVSSQDNANSNSVKQNSRYDNTKDRKTVVKKSRLVPEVQPTRTSRLRSKGTNSDSKNSLSSRSHQDAASEPLPKKTVQKQRPKQTTTSLHSDDSKSIVKERTSVVEGNKMKNSVSCIPSTPTAHQEKILEQLSSLRRGLMMKDQELMTRILSMNEYEIQT